MSAASGDMGLERADGALRLAWHVRNGRTRVASLYQRAPLRVLFPDGDVDLPAEAVLVNTAGGIVGGDRLQVELKAEAGTCVTVTSQAAEKLYRAAHGAARIATRVNVAADAWFEWLPQETILFDGGRLERQLEISLEPGARLLAAETLLFGRAARGELLRCGHLHDSWAIRLGGRLAWADRTRLDGDLRQVLDRPFGFGGAVGMTTILHAGPAAASFLPRARELVASVSVDGGATVVGGQLLIRLLARDGAGLRAAAAHLTMALRHEITGMRPVPPRVWRS